MNLVNKIPFLDLIAPHKELERELVSVLRRALKTGAFVGGPMVEDFEHDFAQFCGARYCVGVASGTDALRFALMAAGVQRGDGVITVPNTFIATTEAISQAGAQPQFVDIDEQTYNMDPMRLQEYLEFQCSFDQAAGRAFSRKTGAPVTAVVPVHLYGQMADMDPILDLAEQYNLMVIEDACQAHGAEYFSRKDRTWKRAGSMGNAAAFSFYPGKNLGACGEAGAVTTNDIDLAQSVSMLRDHGQAQKYYHEMEGYNGRLDAIQAGILKLKLTHLPDWLNKRRKNAANYNELFKTEMFDLVLPHESCVSRSVHHLYVIRTQERDDLKSYLADAGIGTGIHYPVPLHLQNAYRQLGYHKGDFPVAEQIATEIISLPMYPGLQCEQQAEVVRSIGAYFSGRPTLRDVVVDAASRIAA